MFFANDGDAARGRSPRLKRETPAVAGVVGSAESGCPDRIGAGGERVVQTRHEVISQRSVTRSDFSDGNGGFPPPLQGLTCDPVSPAEPSPSLARSRPLKACRGSRAAIMSIRETAK